jgi:SAM-dependent methyltransferase
VTAPAPEVPRERLFDLAAEYDDMLGQGIRLSGEDRHFFIRGRLAELVMRLPPGLAVRRILDFGCGIGDTSRRLAETFAGAEVVGVDTAERALAWARDHHASERVRFAALDDGTGEGGFDLVYVNGVFHHVAPAAREGLVRRLHDALRPGGCLALFENNPWNPGTRLVMRRIPFDRDAEPLVPTEARRLVARGGFACAPLRFLFYFPRPLAFLRGLEAWLGRVPLGAQYLVLGVRL